MKNDILKPVLAELAAVGIEPDLEHGKKHLKLSWMWNGRRSGTSVSRRPSSEWHARVNARNQIRRKLAGVER